MKEWSIHLYNSIIFDTEGPTPLEKKQPKENRRINIRTTNNGKTRGRIRTVTYLSMLRLMMCCLHDGDDDNNDNDGDRNSNDKTHLHGNTLSVRHGE